jgi:hypothetical protein
MKSIKKYQGGGTNLNPGANVYRFQGGSSPTFNSMSQGNQAGGVGSSSMYGDAGKAARASSIAAGVGGIGDLATGVYNIFNSIRESKQSKAEIERLRKTAPVLTTPSQFYEAQKMAYDQRLVELQRDAVARNVSQSLQTVGQLGGRAALGAVSSLQTGADRAMQEVGLDAAKQRMEATSQLGFAREREQGRTESRYRMDLGNEQDRYASARAGVGQGIGQALGGAANVALMAFGVPPVAKDGAVVKTPGKFSHDKNPIDIVKSGAKIGEMTGGEYIFNPKQMEKIKTFVATDDKSKLHSYVKSLIRKFNSK